MITKYTIDTVPQESEDQENRGSIEQPDPSGLDETTRLHATFEKPPQKKPDLPFSSVNMIEDIREGLPESPVRKTNERSRRETDAANSFEDFLKNKNLFDLSMNALFEDGSPQLQSRKLLETPRADVGESSEFTLIKESEPGSRLPAQSLKFESRLAKNAMEYFKKKRSTCESIKKAGVSKSTIGIESKSSRNYQSIREEKVSGNAPTPALSNGSSSKKRHRVNQSDNGSTKRTSMNENRQAGGANEKKGGGNEKREPTIRCEYMELQYPDGSSYCGYMLGKLRHGSGLLRLRDSSFYDGDWVHGKMSGIGKLSYCDGSLAYQGGFLDNKPHGHGLMFNINVAKKHQAFEMNYRDFSDIGGDWEYYEGIFQEGKKQGLGKMAFRNGDQYLGHFEDDMISGLGRYHRKDGILVGIWLNNILIKSLN